MAPRPPAVANGDLADLSRELKSLIDAAQRLRDRINRHLSLELAPRMPADPRMRGRPPVPARKPHRPSRH